MAIKKITVEGSEITLLPRTGTEDFISLSDIMRKFDDEFAVYGWMRNKNTIEFLGVWEQLHNPVFNSNEFVRIKNEAGANSFNMTPKKWIAATDAIGVISKVGRYDSGIFAHRDIAINFCYWLSPTFQLYLIKEFQRLKEEEAQQSKEGLDWDLKRTLSKINYRIHTDAVKSHLLPPRVSNPQVTGIIYSSEADLLNIAMFGCTAKEWQLSNPTLKGNIRDAASTEQLLVLANLENLNAHLIKEGVGHDERLLKLNEVAIYQLDLLSNTKSVEYLKSLPKKVK
jgi:KilA-N domain